MGSEHSLRATASGNGPIEQSNSDHTIDGQETQLVARLRDGDSDALRTIIAHYANRLSKFAFYIVGSRDTAEDVVQYVFIHLWDRRESLDSNSRLKSYLFRAVQNRSLNELARETTRASYQRDVLEESEAGIVPVMVTNPEDAILTRAVVQSAIEQLSERRRLAIRLRMEEEMSHAEIGEVLEISAMAAQRLVARAIMDLRAILQLD